MSSTAANQLPAQQAAPKKDARREWAPRIWEGIDFFAWVRLLARNRFAVHWRYLYIALIVTPVSMWHTSMRWLQALRCGRQVAATEIKDAPIFIIGHWRTGTTLMHELMILDERFNYPNTYECLEPNHFLLTENFIKKYMAFLSPTHRPMDNMKAGFDRPQEDEFALCMIGLPSPYLTIAFPNNGPVFPEYLDLEGLSPAALANWKHKFVRFLKQLTFKNPKRLVLKSPTHTARIKHLLDLFPDARFVHIVRDPYVVFPSTVHLWKKLWAAHCFHPPTYAGLEEHVLETFVRMYQRLEEGKKLVAPARFYELRYEDLVKNPADEMRKLYEQLGLDGFDAYEPRLKQFLETIKDYETNKYQLSPEQREQVTQRWGDVIRRYGYDRSEVNGQPPVA